MSPAVITVRYQGGDVRGQDATGAEVTMHEEIVPVYRQATLKPGKGFEMSDGRVYVAHSDGSLRRAGREKLSKKARRARRQRERAKRRFAQALPALEKLAAERRDAWTEDDERRARESHEYAVAHGLRPDPKGGQP